MNKLEAKNLVFNTFEKSFDASQFTYFVKNLLNNLDESKSQTWSGNYIPESFHNAIKFYKRIGQYTDPDKNVIDVLTVNVKKDITLERARTLQRNFIARHLKQRNHQAALVAFYTEEYDDWRFSLVKMDFNLNKAKIEIELSPAKRYSFLVGSNERSHTAQSQFQKILSENQNPTLDELEQAFNIETVTKEFFFEYRELFIRTKLELDKVLKNDLKLKTEFELKNVNSVDFSKKLLGQIIFLYFLQKKGWFGVERDSDWGTGSKKFLRELLDKKHGDYNNFFNDILEPLFYEALRYDRQDYYYSRFNCKIPFLNGGLFDPINNYDWVHTDITLPNNLFSNNNKTLQGDVGDGIFDIFDRYNFTVIEDEPLEKEVAIDPELLGKAYEKFNAIRPDNFDEYSKALKSGKKGDENKFNKQYGVYYTPREIVHYMCRESLINYLASEFNDRTDAYQKVSTEQLDAFGNTTRKGQLSLETEYKPNSYIPMEDIETLINNGEHLSENEAVVESKGKETETYYYKLPGSIRKNAKLIDDKLSDILICDPAVGSGAFPVGMMHEIVSTRNLLSIFIKESGRSIYNFKRECIENSLYGVDIDSGAVEIAKLRLWLSLVVDEDDFKEIKPLPNLDYKIVRGNSLIGFPENWKSPISEIIENLKKEYFTETRPQQKNRLKEEIENLIKSRLENSEKNFGYKIDFDFKTFFSEVFHHKRGFDIVIANPPYVKVQNLTYEMIDTYKRIWSTAWKRIDISTIFFELGYSLINDNGNLCYISSNQFLSTEYGRMLRKFLSDNGLLRCIIDFADLPVFENALTYVSIFIISKKYQEHFRYYKVPHLPFEPPSKFIRLNLLGFGSEVWSLSENQSLDILKKIQLNTDRLDCYAKCWAGIITGKDELLLYDINKKISHIEKELLIPIIRAQGCFRYGYAQPIKQSYYPYKEINDKTVLINLDELKLRYPKTFNFIVDHKKELKARKDSRKLFGSKDGWYGLIRFGRLSTFKKTKIVSPGEVKENRFSLDISGSAFSCARVFSITSENVKLDIRYLLAILNSKVIEFYLHNTASLKHGGYYSYSSTVIDSIPLKFSSINQDRFISLVDKILKVKQKNPLADTKHLEDKIDIMVYKLYNLTYEEAKIIDPEIEKIISKEEYNNYKVGA